MKLQIKEKGRNFMSNNSDIFHFTLGIFAGLMVVNTADFLVNGALTTLAGVTYGTIKSISKFV